MGKKALSSREPWQPYGGQKAEKAEYNFLDVFSDYFQNEDNKDFEVKRHPREFRDIYSGVKLPEDIVKRIYSPDEKWIHGIIPDFSIHNKRSRKTIYVEVKRQDGWVEGKERKAGRGNAHERSCKLFTPGLLKVMRDHGNIQAPELPFWVVFEGDIARDPKRVRELYFWYTGVEGHFFLWTDLSDKEALIKHFEKHIKILLV